MTGKGTFLDLAGKVFSSVAETIERRDSSCSCKVARIVLGGMLDDEDNDTSDLRVANDASMTCTAGIAGS